MLSIYSILNTSPIVPVCVINDVNDAVPLANALLEGGIKTCEITLRTPKAIEAIEAIAKSLPQMIVGAGSVQNFGQFEDAINHGSQFIVSPGLIKKVVEKSQEKNIPILPGVMTPSEILYGLNLGINTFKLFPANIAGGVDFLQAVSGPISTAQFCPTGGVSLSNMNKYLSCQNVVAVGGTWLTPLKLIENKDFKGISEIVRKSLKSVKISSI